MERHIIAMRHGERADRHPSSREYSVAFDPCLTERGMEQAASASQRVASMVCGSVHLVSSPFLRCLETASKLSSLLGVPIHIEEGFGEFLYQGDFSYGPFDDLTYKQMSKASLEEKIGAKVIINDHCLRPQFPEHFNTVYSRVRRAWELYENKIQDDTVIIVTHLYVLGGLTSIFTNREEIVDEDGYCKFTYAVQRGRDYEVKVHCDRRP